MNSQLLKKLGIVLGVSLFISLVFGPSSNAIDKSGEITSATESRIMVNAYYEQFTLYKGTSIYKSIYNQYASNGKSTGNLQIRDDFSAILIDFSDYQIYSPYGQQTVRIDSQSSQNINDNNARIILAESNRARNWIDGLSCSYTVQVAERVIPIEELKFDLDAWQNELNRRESRNPILGGTGLGWSSSSSGGGYWSEEWFGNGIAISLIQNYLEAVPDGISYHIKLDRNILPTNFGTPGFDIIDVKLNCINNTDLKWKLMVGKKFKVVILLGKQIPTIKVKYEKSVNLNEKAVAINPFSESDAVIQITSLSRTICVAVGTGILLKQPGSCRLKLFQAKNEEFAASKTLIEFTVNTAIVCFKGKLTKTVTAVKPVCPAGYMKK
jgi:hypothetical protein